MQFRCLTAYSPPGLEEVLIGQPGTCQLPIILAHFGAPNVKSLISLVIHDDGSNVPLYSYS
jgi:hypothetical protein